MTRLGVVPVAQHTIDTDRFPDGGLVLDVGARGWDFSRNMARWGCRVHALDPSPDLVDPNINGVFYHRLALVPVGEIGIWQLARGHEPEAYHLVDTNTPKHESENVVPVMGEDIDSFSRTVGVDFWHVVKLNCEGTEYGILESWPGPIADQISVSFHEHTGAHRDRDMNAILQRLEQWYTIVQHERDERYCAGPNYWDTLLVLK